MANYTLEYQISKQVSLTSHFQTQPHLVMHEKAT